MKSEVIRRNYYKGDYESMKKDLSIIDCDSEFEGLEAADMLDIFIEKTSCATERHVPKSQPRNKKENIPSNKETVEYIRRKHRLWERYMENQSKEKYREYCKARNKVKRLTKRKRKE
ncbi:hypothetical protein FSP39_007699 [Pinctada imbricata]|uniref:Uncharacterized protein n=1 Tax=Pinctada imbricata TaxID=66713 RepID=A0AA88YI93_PINIB|nr:hypothetical protein FSP39_007699 [Pinctada imbricata]